MKGSLGLGGGGPAGSAVTLGADGEPAISIVAGQPANVYTSAQVIAAGVALANWEIWNPTDSGVDFVLQHLTFEMTVAGTVNVYRSTAHIATEILTGSTGLDPNAAPTEIEFYREDGAATTGTTKIGELAISIANVDVPCWWMDGFTIPPGAGLRFQHTQNSAKFKPKLSWQEVPR